MSETKTCTKCKRELPLGMFNVRNRKTGNLKSSCRWCCALYYRAWHAANRDYVAEQARVTRAQPAAKIRKMIRQRARTATDPARPLAHRIARKALLNGEIVKKPCEKCGNVKAEMHHDNYREAKNVRWLCRKHHAELHRQFPDIGHTPPSNELNRAVHPGGLPDPVPGATLPG